MSDTSPVSHIPASAKRRFTGLLVLCIALAIIGITSYQYRKGLLKVARYAPTAARGVFPNAVQRVAPPNATAKKIVDSSHAQIGTVYDAAYKPISYPGGDVAKDKGACTDVVVRALRGVGIDLQKLMHEDMKKNFRRYPQKWGLERPDKNIDHRRVPNQMRFFERFGQTLTKSVDENSLKHWLPGDIVCWDMQNGQLHTGIVSDGLSSAGVPLVIHNGWVCVEDDSLTRWKIIGHYRFPK
jgi:uncharacterized protein YijF (DUF1287 family)